MAKADATFIYVGTYPSEDAAQADYDVVKDLHAAGAVGTIRRSRHQGSRRQEGPLTTKTRRPPAVGRGAAGGTQSRKAGEAARCEQQGHRQGRSGDSEGSQLSTSVFDASP